MPSLEVNGVSLFYAEKGAGEPVVFVHGIPTDYRAWDLQLDTLSEHYRAISYSRRYASPNARKGDLLDSTVENNSSDLMGLLEKLRVTPAHIVGHSYGGFISLYLAAHHPDLVRSLVLVEPAVSTLLVKNPKNILEFLLLLLRSPSVALAAARYVRKGNNPAFKALGRGDLLTAVRHNLDAIENKEGVLDKLPAKRRGMMIDNARTVGELRTRFPVFTRDDAKRIRTPSLLISGESSALVLRRIAEILADSIPNAEKVRILGAGHFPHLDKAEEFNTRVLGFLQRHR